MWHEGPLTLSLSPSRPPRAYLFRTMRPFLLPTPVLYQWRPQHHAQQLNAPRPSYAAVLSRFPSLLPLREQPPLTGGFLPSPISQRPAPSQKPILDEEHFLIAREHFKFIKCLHHLSVLNSSIPKSLLKTAAGLHMNLHPAFATDDFASSAKRAADTWLNTTVDTLRSHYDSLIHSSEAFFRDHPLAANVLDSCLSVATSWARKQLGKRLSNQVLQRSLDRIRSLSLQPQRSISHTPATPHPSVQSVGIQTVPVPPSEIAPTVTPPSNKPSAVMIPPTPCSSRKRRRHSSDSSPKHCASSPAPSRLRSSSVPSLEASPLQPNRVVDQIPTSTAIDVITTSNAAFNVPATPSTMTKTTVCATPTSSVVQLDLFGSPATRAPPSRFDECHGSVIIGDSNLSAFPAPPNCTVFAHSNGRLSHFKAILSSTKTVSTSVSKLIVCLSTLDVGNSFTTNSSTLKSLLGAARRVFPKATIFVSLLGIHSSLSSDESDNVKALNHYVINKRPSSCIHILAPDLFNVSKNVLCPDTRKALFSKIMESLNSK